jgi:hypothetical protein
MPTGYQPYPVSLTQTTFPPSQLLNPYQGQVAPETGPAPTAPASAPQTLRNRRTGVASGEVGPRRSKRSVRFNPVQPEKRSRKDKRGGRRPGSTNYSDNEVDAPLDLIAEELPVGGKGWGVVGARLRDAARTGSGFPVRSDASLKVKFRQVWELLAYFMCFAEQLLQILNIPRPTGKGECPDFVERAHQLNDLIQSKIGSRKLADDEIVDSEDSDDPASESGNESDMADDEDPREAPPTLTPSASQPAPCVRTVRVDTPLQSRLSNTNGRKPTTRGLDLLTSMSEALDPQNIAQRESERTSMMFYQQQLLVLQNQNFSPQTQLNQSERRRNIAERKADRLEYKLGLALSAQSRGRHVSISPPPAISRITRWQATYRDGGHFSWFGRYEDGPADVADAADVRTIPWSPTSPPYQPTTPPDSVDGASVEELA